MMMLISMRIGRVLISRLQWTALAEMKFPCQNGTSTATLRHHHGGGFLGRSGGRFLRGSDGRKKIGEERNEVFFVEIV